MDFVLDHPIVSLFIVIVLLCTFFGAERVGSTVGDYARQFYDGGREGFESAVMHATQDGGLSVESH